MADLGPAWIGLSGVLVGAVAAQAGDAIRARSDRRRRNAERQQLGLLDVLRHVAVVASTAAVMAETIHNLPRSANVHIDTREMDSAITELTRSVDVMRVVGPHELVEPALDLFERAVELRQLAANMRPPAEIEAKTSEVYHAKMALLDVAAASGLAAPVLSESSARQEVTRSDKNQ